MREALRHYPFFLFLCSRRSERVARTRVWVWVWVWVCGCLGDVACATLWVGGRVGRSKTRHLCAE